MLGLTRWNTFDDVFNFQREVDRLFNQFWNELPTRTAGGGASPAFQVSSNEDQWLIDVPMPGVDPQYVNLEVAGNTVSIRVLEPGDSGNQRSRYEQAFTVPHFLDLDQIKASHQHGMLRLTLPIKESVKPRRVSIDTTARDQKQLNTAA
jgi:HSP20 family protein